MTDKDMVKYLEYKIYKLNNKRDHLKNVELNVASDNNDHEYVIDILAYIGVIEDIVALIEDSIKNIKGE